MSKLILIDGNAILHRAFHALPPLTNPKGEIVNAVYGFFSMFLKILEDAKPDCVVVCFDRPKPTFRKELYVQYQAHRPKMDDNLVPQIGIVHEILEKMKVQIFELDRYEADDIIGTLAVQAVSQKDQRSKIKDQKKEETAVIIVSGDRDLLQLVNNKVKMLAPITGITNMLLYDEQKVEEKYGIKQKQIIDYKALVGDASDNYPGVSGVGPKTAVNLLKEYQTLEVIYKNLDLIKQKNPNLAAKLKVGEESAEMAKKLATIVTDVPVTLNLTDCSTLNFNIEGLKEEFEKFGFKSLIKRLESNASENKKSATAEIQKKNEAQKKKKEGEQLGLL